MKLHELMNKQKGKVVSITLDEENTNRLFYLGIYPGAIVQKLKSAPLRDPILYMVGATQLVLRKADASKIEVEVCV